MQIHKIKFYMSEQEENKGGHELWKENERLKDEINTLTVSTSINPA